MFNCWINDMDWINQPRSPSDVSPETRPTALQGYLLWVLGSMKFTSMNNRTMHIIIILLIVSDATSIQWL
jgi:hypothetical protein